MREEICPPVLDRCGGFESLAGNGGEPQMNEIASRYIKVTGSDEPVTLRQRNVLEGQVRGITVRIYPPIVDGGLATIEVGNGLQLVDCCGWSRSVVVWKTAELLRKYLDQEEVC